MKKKLLFIISLILIVTTSTLLQGKKPGTVKKINTLKKLRKTKDIPVTSPPFSEGIFPCTECHNGSDVNYRKRKLVDMHDNIVLRHDEKNRWCLDCHSATKRDWLHLASGELISFKKSYKLCGQCHGPKLRDWKRGIHGKRTGEWNGQKKYYLCVHCHNPHSPRFKKLKPLPPPLRPEDNR